MTDLTDADALVLCERALQIDITLAEAQAAWSVAPVDPELAEIRDDLFFALEHVPSSRRHPAGDPDRWRQMPEYDDLLRMAARLRERLDSSR